jgi:PKD repeat protein
LDITLIERMMKWKKQKTLLMVILSAILLFADIGSTGATPPEVEWNRTFGGAGIERAEFVKQTSDNGYLLVGSTRVCRECPEDVWLVKTDPKGEEQWNKTFRKTGNDQFDFFQQTSDDGYIRMTGSWDNYSIVMGKIDVNGNMEWEKPFGNVNIYTTQQTSDGGLIIGSSARSAQEGSFFKLVKTDSAGDEQWNKTFKGTLRYKANTIQQTLDGGYIIGGSTDSWGVCHSDFWLMKTDANGNEQWTWTSGGSNHDWIKSVHQTADGSYILRGWTFSYDDDFWLIKIDPRGKMLWVKTFEDVESFQQTSDGGYILAGDKDSDFHLIKLEKEPPTPTALFIYDPKHPGVEQMITFNASLSYDPDEKITNYQWNFGDGNTLSTTEKTIIHSYASKGTYNVTVTVKNNNTAMHSTNRKVTVQQITPPQMEWKQTIGGIGFDNAYSVQQTCDGGYISAGRTGSYGSGGGDFWLVKTDSNGKEQWNRTFGGTDYDYAHSVMQTLDGGYILAGNTRSYGAGESDVWLVKTDSLGYEQWNRTFGGTDRDSATSVTQAEDGGYILAGETYSYGAGRSDVWLVKTDSKGYEQWNKTFGGINDDRAESVRQTSDGGYILAGRTGSFGLGWSDVWLIKIDTNGNMQWNQTFGGTRGDWAESVQQTSDGGFIIAGTTTSYGAGYFDFWLIKTDSKGKEQWNQTFEGSGDDWAHSVIQTSDGGYVIVGKTGALDDNVKYDQNDDLDDMWLVKTDSKGNMEWYNSFGSTGFDWANCIQQTSDGGYIIAGKTDSYRAGDADVWLIKLEGNLIQAKEDSAQSEKQSPYTQEKLEGNLIQTKEDSAQSEKQSPQTQDVPGFNAAFAIGSLLSVGYFVLRKSLV